MNNNVVVVSSCDLPYGSDIASRIDDLSTNEVRVDHIVINTYHPSFLLSRQFHALRRLRTAYSAALISLIISKNPDFIVFFLGPSPFSEDHFIYLRERLPSVRIFTWFIDVLSYNKDFTRLAYQSDIAGSISPSDIENLERNKPTGFPLRKTVLMQCFFNDFIFYPISTPRTVDVFFVGSWSNSRLNQRRKCLKWLAEISRKHKLRSIIVSRSNLRQPILFFRDMIKGLPFLQFIQPGPVFGQALSQYYRKSRFTLECPADTQLDAIPMRSYEAKACGAKVVSYDISTCNNTLGFSTMSELERILVNRDDDLLSQDNSSYSSDHPDSLTSRVRVILTLLGIPFVRTPP